MYNGENHMVVGFNAYLEEPKTAKATADILVATAEGNLTLWAGHELRDLEVEDGTASFSVTISCEPILTCDDYERECYIEEEDMSESVDCEVRSIDIDAEVCEVSNWWY